jgi:hypothetical protein
MICARRWIPLFLITFFSYVVCFGEEPAAKARGLTRSLVVAKQGYFPVAIRLQDGRIAVVLRGGAGHLGLQGRLDMVFSSDDGRTWMPPQVVVDSPVDDRNPALGQARDGTLVVGFWRTAQYDDQGRYAPNSDKPVSTWVTRSCDGGKIWSEATAIDVAEFGWGSPFGKIVTMPDGSMVMAIYGGQRRKPGQQVKPDRDHSYVYRSADNGQTWKYLAEIGDGKQQLNETALLRLSSGKLIAAIRSRAGDVWLSDSADGGRTWTTTRPLTPRSVHPADLIELDGGRVLLVVGNRVGPFGVLGLVSDRQQQFDWPQRFTLVDDAVSGDCGYPSSVKLAGGRALTFYYATRAKDHPEWGVHCGAVVFNVPPAP